MSDDNVPDEENDTSRVVLINELKNHFTCSNQPGSRDWSIPLAQQQQQQQQENPGGDGGGVTNATTSTTTTRILPPKFLSLMWENASEWHLLEQDHFGVFGFNLYPPDTLESNTIGVFGDEDNRNESSNNGMICAADGWYVCFSFSEFDYLLVNMNNDGNGNGENAQENPYYGSVRHLINNCDEENFCTSSVYELMWYVLKFIKEGKERKEMGIDTMDEDDDDDDDGTNNNQNDRNKYPKCLNQTLQRIRHSIIETIIDPE